VEPDALVSRWKEKPASPNGVVVMSVRIASARTRKDIVRRKKVFASDGRM